jgi:hypothetical protein
MLNRRGYAPIYHAYSSVLYGTVGNSGVSECSDWKGSAMHGCIPGNWCEGNHTPYISISEEPAAMVLEAAPGDGFGLDSVWAPTKDWIYSQAKYNERLPTIPIEDDQPIITVEDLTVS